MLQKSRAFFAERGVLEVDCPVLTQDASVDLHIDLMTACFRKHERRFLFTSPEYGMKRLLCDGIGDIYQLSHVFRDGECGSEHNPEFMMAEWYRLGFSLGQMIEETKAYVALFIGEHPLEYLAYDEAFLKYAGIDIDKASDGELLAYLGPHAYPEAESEGRDALLNLILGEIISPKLGNDCLTVLYHFPETQSALAQLKQVGGKKVAERFELFFQGKELANGYHELGDAVEQRERFHEANRLRKAFGKEELPPDERLLQALERGLPDCSGVAVGFDRLMMLRHRSKHISEILFFHWHEA